MEEKKNEYLKSIGISEIVNKRINELIEQVENLSKEKVVDILVTDYVNEDGMRIYENLRVWTDSFKIIIVDFLTESKINLSPKNELLAVVQITAKDFDFLEPSTNSRLYIAAKTYFDNNVPLKGSGINCAKVMEMYHKYIAPYVVPEG